MKRFLLPLLLSSLGWALAGGAQPAPQPLQLTLNLGGQQARGELLRPATSTPAPLVLLIQGTGPEDMNGSFTLYGGGVRQGSLGQLAQALAAQGFAVMRFDKRYAAQTFEPKAAAAAQQAYATLTMQDLLADAHTALNTALAQGGIDKKRVYIYGWSEGSIIAAHLALDTHASGLIVQGPVVASFADTFTRQFEQVGLKYLTPYAKDGKIDLAGVMAAFGGQGSGLAKMQAQLLLALDSTPQAPKLSSVLDTNKDGQIDLKAEALPTMRAMYPQILAQSPMYAPATSLSVLGELAPKLKMPVLILQGENDGNIDPAYAKQFAQALRAAGNKSVTLKLYAGLGHSLGAAPSLTQDDFAPMQSAPMNDMAAWLRGQR